MGFLTKREVDLLLESICFHEDQVVITDQTKELLSKINVKRLHSTEFFRNSSLIKQSYGMFFQWREDQFHILNQFMKFVQQEETAIFCVQSIFGSGKSTLLKAKCCFSLLNKWTDKEDNEYHFREENILISAYNVSIKTELEKEITKVFPKVQIKTYDGLILKALTVLNKSKHSTKGGDVDFQQRRTEIYETLNSVSKKHQDTSIKIIFIDEGQDMDCQSIEFFFTFYPKAKLVIVGDFCQSISKTPTNSLLHRVITNREKVYIYRHHLNPVYF